MAEEKYPTQPTSTSGYEIPRKFAGKKKQKPFTNLDPARQWLGKTGKQLKQKDINKIYKDMFGKGCKHGK